jgi:hypothetical protein
MTYDYIIVGGGISGLYSAYRLLKSTAKNDAKKILVLEKNKSRWIGGRMGYYPFHGMDVSIGCGIGRKKKDKLLIALLHDLDVAYKEIHVTNQIADNIEYSADVSYIVSLLRQEFLRLEKGELGNNDVRGMTFKQFALPVLGKKVYDTFLMTCGYTDFENEDVYETLYYYGMDDNTSGWTGLSISWRTLLQTLLKKIENKVEIKSSSHVTNVVEILEGEPGSEFIVKTESGDSYSCKHVILATTVDTVRKLLPKHKIYNDIVGQPFLRIYGKFSKECIPIMREHFSVGTMVKGAIHRIIPMNIDSGIYMIVYTDNKGALALKNHIDHNRHNDNNHNFKNREYFCRLIEKSCDLPSGSLFLTDMVSFYWNIGTHYYKPLSNIETSRKEFIYKAQHPMPNMFVVGEMVSRNQGWVEGALESVDAVIS